MQKKEAYLVCFITEEVDFRKIIKVPQAVCLVPSLGENLLQAY